MLNRFICALVLITATVCQVNPITEGKKLARNVTFDNFEVTVQNGTRLPYFIFFKMNKCGHCRMFEPTFYKLAYDMKAEPVAFGVSNIDDDSE